MLCNVKNGTWQIGTSSIRAEAQLATGFRFVNWVHDASDPDVRAVPTPDATNAVYRQIEQWLPMTDRATDNVLALTTRTPCAQHLQGFFQQSGRRANAETAVKVAGATAKRCVVVHGKSTFLSGTSRGNDYDDECYTRAVLMPAVTAPPATRGQPMAWEADTSQQQVGTKRPAPSTPIDEAEDQRKPFESTRTATHTDHEVESGHPCGCPLVPLAENNPVSPPIEEAKRRSRWASACGFCCPATRSG